MTKFIKYLFLSVLLLVIVLQVAVTLLSPAIDQELSRMAISPLSGRRGEVWGHAGYTADGSAANSVAGLNAAVERQLQGVELDIHYDHELKGFVVAHDPDYDKKTVLPLDEVLERFGSLPGFWLDFKNLSRQPPWRVSLIAEKLTSLLDRYGCSDKTLVESRNPVYLSLLAHHGIQTAYHLSISKIPAIFRIEEFLYKFVFIYGRLSSFSIGHNHSDGELFRHFSPIPFIVSTINDPDKITRLQKQKTVLVILSDRPR